MLGELNESKRAKRIAPLALATAALAAYLPLLRFTGPTTSDLYILLSSHRTLAGALAHPLLDGEKFYRPVAQLAYWLAWNIFDTSFGLYFLIPILLHLASSLLLYFLLRREVSTLSAFVGAVLFSLHPSMLDILPGLDRWADMLMGLALLGALWSAGCGASRQRRLVYIAGCSFLAVASKEPGALVALLVVVASAKRGRKEWLAAGATSSASVALFVLLRMCVLGLHPGGYGECLDLEMLKEYAYRVVFPTPWVAHPDSALGWLSVVLLLLLCGWLARIHILSCIGLLAFGLLYFAFASFAPWHLYTPLAILSLGVGHSVEGVRKRDLFGRVSLAVVSCILALALWGAPRHWLDRSWPAVARITGELSGEILLAARGREHPIFATLPAHIDFNPEERCYSTWNSIFYPDSVFGLLALHDAPARFSQISLAIFTSPDLAVETLVRPGSQVEMSSTKGALTPCQEESGGLSRTIDYVAAVSGDGRVLSWWRAEDRVLLTWSAEPPHLRRGRAKCRVRPVGLPVLPGESIGFWNRGGTAFSKAEPLRRTGQQQIFNPGGGAVVNSFTNEEGDAAKGRLIGPWVKVLRGANHVCAWVGGGGPARDVGVELRGAGNFKKRLVGADAEMMVFRCADIRGQEKLRPVLFDNDVGPWGHIIVGKIGYFDIDCDPGFDSEI